MNKLQSEGSQAMFQLFHEIAASESDCGSAQKGGDLGPFGRGLCDEFCYTVKYLKLFGVSQVKCRGHLKKHHLH